MEQDFKLLASYQMGGIIGRPKLPSLRLYRERIPKIVEQMDMAHVMVEAAKEAHKIFGFSKSKYSLNPYECKEVSHKAHEEHRGRKTQSCRGNRK